MGCKEIILYLFLPVSYIRVRQMLEILLVYLTLSSATESKQTNSRNTGSLIKILAMDDGWKNMETKILN